MKKLFSSLIIGSITFPLLCNPAKADEKISVLQKDNKKLKAEIEVSKAKNKEIISQNQKLLARLEKLENIALKFQSSLEMISVATKD